MEIEKYHHDQTHQVNQMFKVLIDINISNHLSYLFVSIEFQIRDILKAISTEYFIPWNYAKEIDQPEFKTPYVIL